MEECKKTYEEKERKQKAENEEKLVGLQLTIKQLLEARKNEEETKRKEFAALELIIQEMLKVQKQNLEEKIDVLELAVNEVTELQAKAEQKREQDFSKNAIKIEEIKENVANDILKVNRSNEESVKNMFEEKCELAARLTVTQVEFEAKLQLLTKQLEEKGSPTHQEETPETDCQQDIDTLKLENEEIVHRICADLKGEYDEKMEKVKEENKQIQRRMVDKLEKMAKENSILSKKLEDKEKEENNKIKSKSLDKGTKVEPSEERKMIGDENKKISEKVRNKKEIEKEDEAGSGDSFIILDTTEASEALHLI